MSKKAKTPYNKGTMKTLNAKTIKAKKDNLHKRFQELKEAGKEQEKIRDGAVENLTKILNEMASIQASYATLEELEGEMTPKKITRKKK